MATKSRYYTALDKRGRPFCPPGYHQGACLIRQPIAAIGADAGDVLVYTYDELREPAQMFGKVREIPREDYEAIRAVMDELGPENLFAELGDLHSFRPPSGLVGFLKSRGRWGKDLQVPYRQLRLLKPWTAYRTISKPISAASGKAAIKALLLNVGSV